MIKTVLARGMVYYVDLGNETDSNIQSGLRPCVIISNNKNNRFNNLVGVVPFTSKLKRLDLPTHVLIKSGLDAGLTKDSVALCEQIIFIDKHHIKECVGELDEFTMKKIEHGVSVQLGLSQFN